MSASAAEHEQLEQRLLGVPAVFGLVPDTLATPVEDALGDLLADVRGQAVKRHRVWGGAIQQGIVKAIGASACRRAAAVSGASVMLNQTSV